MSLTLALSCVCSVFGGYAVYKAIPQVTEMFISAGLYGRDMGKTDRTRKIAESMGMVTGTVFLLIMFLFLAVPFGQLVLRPKEEIPHSQLAEFLTAILSVCCMLFLGFVDDVLNLKWRYKLVLPTIASLPLLITYYINHGLTTVVVPLPIRSWLGLHLDIGVFYYVYMALLAVFCTNAINIFAGINGLEVGQAVVIACSLAVFNLLELWGPLARLHLFSLYLLLPFIFTSLALLKHNWYPASVFVGDTYCYFAGMTFAVVAIIGHFSKTLLLFFLPQIINFGYSLPQLARIVPCPRHRLPRFDARTGLMNMSVVEFKPESLPAPLLPLLRLLSYLHLVNLEEGVGEDSKHWRMNNMTLINLVLNWTGPLKEDKLCLVLLLMQAMCSAIAFLIRYPLAYLFYPPIASV